MKLYIYGCDCGSTAVYSKRVKAYAKENNVPLDIINSKYSKSDREDHARYLTTMGYNGNDYAPIVVDGRITLLKLWKP